MIAEMQQHEFDLLKEYLLKSSGIDVPPEKQYLFTTRLSEFLAEETCTSFEHLHSRMGLDAKLHQRFVEAMTTHETSFFRDGHPYRTLQEHIIPVIVKMRGISPRKIYIWSMGCSTGQEPYSIAITIHEWCRLNPGTGLIPSDFVIFASDISDKVLNVARLGIYSRDEVARGVPDNLLATYFCKHQRGYSVADEVRSLIQFRELNLSQPIQYIGKFDLLLCRNVMIYFSTELRKRIVRQFHEMLQPEGFLLLGSSETIYGLSDAFSTEHRGETNVYRAVK